MNTLVETILRENSIFQTITSTHKLLKSCSDKCRNVIKNDSNYQSQVSVCTSRCKIQALNKAIMLLNSMYGSGVSQKTIKTKIMYLTLRRNNEIMRLKRYDERLKKRQMTIPVSQSLKPSPERYNPKKII